MARNMKKSATLDSIHDPDFVLKRLYSVLVNVCLSESLSKNVVIRFYFRVFVYLMTPEDLTYNIGATAALFEPCLVQVGACSC